MDMKEQTRNSLLTAMVCVALSSGTAWAAVPEVQVPAVQQSAGNMAESSATGATPRAKAKEKSGQDLSSGSGNGAAAGQVQAIQQRAQAESAATTAAELRSMPLYWSALKPQEEQVKKAQPIIITADDIEAQRKAEKRAAAAQAARGAQKKAGTENTVQPHVEKPAVSKPATVSKPADAPQAQVSKPAAKVPPQAPKAQQPKTASPGPAAKPAPQPAVQAAKPQEKPQAIAPAAQARPEPRQEYVPPQPKAQPAETPKQEVPAPAPAPQPRKMVELHPEGLYASRRQKPLSAPAPKQPVYREEQEERPQEQVQQPARTAQQPLPQQIQVERPPEYEGISDEVVRHIMAGEYAMRYQLSRDASEPGVYHLTQILNQNTGLSHLQKIEYLMGFGRAINRSNLSEYQKKALIDAVIQAFGEK